MRLCLCGHLNSTSLPQGGGCPVPAPKLAVPNQAMAKLPPNVNPAAPERQFNKSLLKLCLFTRKLMIFFPLTGFILGMLSCCFAIEGKKSKEEAHDFCFF